MSDTRECTCGKGFGRHNRDCPAFLHTEACADKPIAECCCPEGYRGVPFNRQAVIDAYVTFAYVNAGHAEQDDPLVGLAWRARVERVKDLATSDPGEGEWDVERQLDAIRELDDDTREHYFALLDTLRPAKPKEDDPSRDVQGLWERVHRKDGVTIYVETREDDPFMVEFTVKDDIAEAWADVHGSLGGGSWEGTGDGDMVYVSECWHSKLIEELKQEGYDLDLSNYYEPDEDDHRAAEHLWGTRDKPRCAQCEYHGEFRYAVEHLAEIDAQAELDAVGAHWEGFVDALAVIARLPLDTWQEKLFSPAVLYPGCALAAARRVLPHAGLEVMSCARLTHGGSGRSTRTKMGAAS